MYELCAQPWIQRLRGETGGCFALWGSVVQMGQWTRTQVTHTSVCAGGTLVHVVLLRERRGQSVM